jgi:dihydroxyacid dehydratase/phosphogluconate dehydratase
LAGGPIGKIRDGDLIEIHLNRNTLEGSINLIGTTDGELTPEEATQLLATRDAPPDLLPHPRLPDDTRLWAALQEASGGTWAGCIYDVDQIIRTLKAGMQALEHQSRQPAAD